MSDYLENITPDSFSGIVFALEGMRRGVVLINGPTGCKFYHAATSDNQTIKQFEFDPLNYPEKWYFGQPRVPCTYLDSRDYVYGSREKLTEGLGFLKENTRFDFLCIVNSPGAALIGDDLVGIVARALPDTPCVTVETPGFSQDVCSGYEKAAIELIRQIGPKPTLGAKADKSGEGGDGCPRSEPVVNLLGLSILHRNHEGDIQELTRLLSLCGIKVGCALCADCGLSDVMKLPDAALNIVVHPEYGAKTAVFLKERYGVPFYVCDGPPVGFSAVEKMMRCVCRLIPGTEIQPFVRESERARARAYVYLSRLNSLTGLPKGVPFSVEGTWSEIYSYSYFLIKHFGMFLESTSVLSESTDIFRNRLLEFLKQNDREEVMKIGIVDAESELVFGSGNLIARLKLREKVFSGIEISLPSLGYVDVVPKTHMGLSGALLLTEQVINGMMF